LNIRIRYFAALREILGVREEVISVDREVTVKELLTVLSERHGETFSLFVLEQGGSGPQRNLQFLINGNNIKNLEGLLTRVEDGDEFAIIPPVGGG